MDFQELILDIALQNLLDEESWACSIDKLLEILEPWLEKRLSDNAQVFLQWNDDPLRDTKTRGYSSS